MVYEAGIEGLTIRDVARRAKCSTSVVFHYFTSKLELLIFTHRAIRPIGAIRSILVGLPTVDRDGCAVDELRFA